MALDLDRDITDLHGAIYNPRKISDVDIEALMESVTTLGIVKPIIVRGTLIVAGHQRTKALGRLGITRAPVYELPKDASTYDEVRFNQLHNGTDLDGGDEECSIAGGFEALGYQIVEPERINGNLNSRLAVVRTEIAGLIVSYGPWGGVVATKSGKVIHAAQYALAAKLTRTPLTTFVIPDERAEEYASRLSKTYGVFSYDHLERQTYIQSLAQMFRLRPGERLTEGFKSTLYETAAIPWLIAHPGAEVIDFGSGQGDYAKKLRAAGHKVSEIELFRRSGASLDLAAINRMVRTMAGRVAGGKLYDAVICDSVLNSVDTLDAEKSVMVMLNALTPIGGTVMFSGRRLESTDSYLRGRKALGRVRYVEFLDEHGFTALYRKGKWFYQKYHSKEQVDALCETYGLQVVKTTSSQTSWQITATKVRELNELAVVAAIDYEFNLPIAPDKRLGLNEIVKEAFARNRDVNNTDRRAMPDPSGVQVLLG